MTGAVVLAAINAVMILVNAHVFRRLRRSQRELDRAIAAWGEMLRRRPAAPRTTIEGWADDDERVLAERGYIR